MSEEYVVREEDIDELVDFNLDLIIKISSELTMELQNLIDYIIYPHSHEEITIYAMALKHRLEEK